MLDYLPIEAGSIYIVDRGYLDSRRFYNIELNKAFFISRASSYVKLKRISSNKKSGDGNSNKNSDDSDGEIGLIISDQIVSFATRESKKNYPQKLRRIRYKFKRRNEKKFRYFTFLTNNLTLEAITIARLYKKRWQIELFFKWIKQHLKIKTFYSYSENGVKIQIWTAICTYLLIAILKKELKIKHSLYTILQVLSVNVFERMPINQLFTDFNYKVCEMECDQPLLF